MSHRLTILAAALACACMNPINQWTGVNYTSLGATAELTGEYELAETYYDRALVNFRVGNTGDHDLSMGMYNLGRVKGYLCKHDEAESLLTESLALEEKTSGPDSELTSMRLFELARLSYDRGKWEQAAHWYSRALGLVEGALRGVQVTHPTSLAVSYDDYARALEELGDKAHAVEARRKAEALLAADPGGAPEVRIRRYPRSCSA